MSATLWAVLGDVRFALRHPVLRRMLYVLGGVTLAAVLVILAYLLPAWQEQGRLDHDLARMRKQLAERRGRADLVKAVERASGQIELIEKKLDARGVQLTLVNQLNQLARRNGIRIASESFDEGKVQDGYAPLFHELTVEGGYAGLRRFLADLEHMPTFSVVREASIAPIGEGTQQLKVHLRMVTYRKAPGPGGAG